MTELAQLRTFPADDSEFDRACASELAPLRDRADDAIAEELEAALVDRYPKVAIRWQEEIAQIGFRRLYAFRDGVARQNDNGDTDGHR